ncbi:MAG: hypothetical protein K0R65_2979 [Crocinitomicaceae bacterium]|jgi:hypothetical protein|nr:hypothetical protein [Crocinitomicaceae bacterium]
MQAYKQYHTLLTTLLGENQVAHQLADQLLESDDHPISFFEKHKETHFHNRGITRAGNVEQTLCFMLDVLGKHEVVYELDWKADSEELNHALRLLSRGRIKDNLFTDQDEKDADGMYELLDMAEELLEEYGLAMITFPLESDSHPIALVPVDQKEKIEMLIDDLF